MFELPVGFRRKDPSFKVIWVFAFEERKVKKLLTKDEILAVKTSEVVQRLIEALPTASAAFEETQRKISLYLASNLILGLVRVHHYQVDCFVTSIERALERIDEPVPEAEIVRHDEGYNLDLSPLPPFSPLHELEPDILPPLEELDNLAVEEPMVEDRGPIEDVAEGQQIQEEGMDVQVEGQVAPAPKERRRRRKRRYSDESEESDRAPRQRRTRRKRAGARNFTARHEDITMPADQPAQLLDELERDLAGDDLVPLDPNAFADLENVPIRLNENTVVVLRTETDEHPEVPGQVEPIDYDNPPPLDFDFEVPPPSSARVSEGPNVAYVQENIGQFVQVHSQTEDATTEPTIAYVATITPQKTALISTGMGRQCMISADDSGLGQTTIYRSTSVSMVEGARREVQYSLISDNRSLSVPPMLVDVSYGRDGSTPVRTLNVCLNYASPPPIMIERTPVPQTPERILSPIQERGTPVPIDLFEQRGTPVPMDEQQAVQVAKTPRKARNQGLMTIEELKRRKRRFIQTRKRRGEGKLAVIAEHIRSKRSVPVSLLFNGFFKTITDEALGTNLARLFTSEMEQIERRRGERRTSEMPSSGTRPFTPLQVSTPFHQSPIHTGGVDSLQEALRPLSPMQFEPDYARPSSPGFYEEPSRPKTPESRMYRDIEYVEQVPLPEGLEHLMSPPRPVPKNIFNAKRKIPNLSCNVTHDQFFTFLLATAFKKKNPVFVFEDLVKDWPRVYIAVNFQNLMMLSQQRRIVLFHNEGKTKFVLMPTEDCKSEFRKMFFAHKEGWNPI